MTPLVSILMPAYNHAAYVAAAVESVLAQDHPRIELVIIDDGSRDGTPDVLRGLLPACERRCERVLLECQENQGTCRTVNRLFDLASGEFCLVLASDDQLAPGALTVLLAPLLADPTVGVVVGDNELMDGEGRRCFWTADRQAVSDPERAAFGSLNAYVDAACGIDRFGAEFGTYSALLRANHVANGCLIRRQALDRCARLTPEAPLEDFWLHLQLAKVTRYRSVRATTFRYRWHASNTSKEGRRMLEMTLQTLAHERRCFRDRLPDGDSRTLDQMIAAVRDRFLLAFVRRPEEETVRALRALEQDRYIDIIPVSDGALRQELAKADVERYGFVAYLADARFLPDLNAWCRLAQRFQDPRVEAVAGRESFVVRASALTPLAQEDFDVRRLRGPGLRWRFSNWRKGRFR